MEYIYIFSSIIIVISLILMLYVSIYNNFQNYIVRINEVEAHIDDILRKRFDLLNKSINIIKANIEVEVEILEGIVKLRSRKLSNFDLDRHLNEAINEFKLYKDTYNKLQKLESFMKIDLAITESEIDLISAKKYYNDTITSYNKMIKKFPSNITAKFSKYKYLPYFDGKDMTDDITNDFKL